ncbi:unnamed protein product [Plasmodium vivax]|uniref:(malaria parasite P. vivax) hypothetical protein n=1 Tax=Plasmodium vivax TaxID=5855 RepID=A0A8S4HHQ1_PLAVI|nr:unnamed protein product [Plasmodium vivax]
MQEIDESKQVPHIFYNKLDDDENVSNLFNLNSFPGISSLIQNYEIRHTLAKLARNIKLIKSGYSENHVKRCRDINYWMDEKIKTLGHIDPGGDLSTYCTSVFNDVKWNKVGEDPIVCKRKKQPYKTNNVEIMKKLDDYCEIRDNIRCDIFKNYDECLRYNRYIKQKKQEFTGVVQGICRDNECTMKDYKIGDNCTLERMDDTFREINCDALYKEAEIEIPAPNIKERSPLEIGSIIHRFKRRKYDLKRNIKREADDRYSLYHSETMPENSEDERYYIEYARPHN